MFPNDEQPDNVNKSVNSAPSAETQVPSSDSKPTNNTGNLSQPQQLPADSVQNAQNTNNFGQNSAIFGSTGVQNPAKKSKKGLLFGLSFLAVIAVLLAVGYVFALYLPAKPDNVYKKSMDRTSKALTQVISKTSSKEQLDKYKKNQLSGNMNIDFAPLKVAGNMNLKYDEKSLDFSLDAKLSQDGQTEKNYKTHILAEQDQKLGYPDIYFIFDGISDFGLENYIPGVDKLDNTWIKIDKNYIKKNVDSLKSRVTNGGDVDVTKDAPQLTNEDIEQLANIGKDQINKYVLTNNPENAILINKKFIAKEKVDDIQTYHYVMGFNKDNLVKACIDTASRYLESGAYKKFANASEQSIKDEKDQAKKSCENSKKDIKDDEEFDMWVDAKYKLIYKIREVDDKQKDTYIEIGQKYKGGDDLHLFINYVSKEDKMNGHMTLGINTATLVSKTEFMFQADDEKDKGKLQITLDGKPLDDDITLDKPTNPKDLEQVMKDLNLNSSSLNQSVLGISTDLRN